MVLETEVILRVFRVRSQRKCTSLNALFTGSERTPGANSDDFWASGSESEDGGLPDGSGGILSPKRSGPCGINLREAMEKAKAQAENKVKVQEASPTHLNAEGDGASSSDWDEGEEEEEDEKAREPSPSPHNGGTTHTRKITELK